MFFEYLFMKMVFWKLVLPLAILTVVLFFLGRFLIKKLAQKIRNRLAIRAGVREALKAERKRKARVNRLAKQKEIAESIFEAVRLEHEAAGCPFSLPIGIAFPAHDGPCTVSVTRCDPSKNGGEPETLVRVVVDLRQPWERQVTVWVGDHVQWPDVYLAPRQVRYLLDKFQIFKV